MKPVLLLAASFLFTVTTCAQRTIRMNNLWAKPEVHVLFQGYKLAFRIKDIDRTLVLLAETGDSVFEISSGLDTAKAYYTELYNGLRMEYRSPLQPLMQRGVGVFLLLAGRAEIVSPRRKRVKEIIANIEPVQRDDTLAYVNFYDPSNNTLLFSGTMAVDLYNKDLGIE